MQTNQSILEEAIAQINAGNHPEAEAILEQYLTRIPCDPFALYLYGSIFADTGRPGLAIALLSQSIQINPEFVPALSNLGVVLRTHGHEEGAKIAYEKALTIDPNSAETLANYSGLYINYGEPDKAIELAERALKIEDSPQARNHIALAMLEKGEYEEGFKRYKARHDLPGWHNRDYKCPEWDGKDTDLLVISGEQGLGDEILFMAWFAEARSRVKNVVVECAPRLIKLFERSFGVKCYANEADVLAECQPTAHISMGDMPALLGIEKRSKQWLVPDSNRVEHYRAKIGQGPRIGLSWKGGLAQTHRHLRNVPIDHWKPFTKHGNCISLQYGQASHNAEKIGIPHWQEAIDDLDELVALIAACDLVISVCNTTIHMAGALGVPCWVMTPAKPAWRYGLRGEMPWYDSVKLYRQTDGWDSVYKQAEENLADFCSVSGTKRKVA